MKKNLFYFITILILMLGMLFVFSGCTIIDKFADLFKGDGEGGGGEPGDGETPPGEEENVIHILKNWDFDDPYSYDEDYLYTSSGPADHDDIEGYEAYVGIGTVGKYRIDLGNLLIGTLYDPSTQSPFIRLYGDAGANGTGLYVRQYIDYNIKDNSYFRIKYKIKSFTGASNADWVEYPIKIIAKINDYDYILYLATSSDGSDLEADYNVPINEWEYGDFKLVNKKVFRFQLSGNQPFIYLSVGDYIDYIEIYPSGHNFDVYVDYIDIYEK